VGRFDSDTFALALRLAGQGPDAQRELTDWLVGLVSARSGMRILDLGSGLGIPTLALAEIVGSTGIIVPVDRSLDALVTLWKSAKRTGRQVLAPVCQDFDLLGFHRARPGVFHRIVASYSLYYSKAPLQTLLALRSMLCQGGRLVIAGPHPLSNRTFRSLCHMAYGRPIPCRTQATRFMAGLLPSVLPQFFPHVDRRVLVTQAVFSDAASLLAYWRAHNWYRPTKDDEIRQTVRAAFRGSDHVRFTKHTIAFVAR
jgi:ubiquinone/menaquinone biosynthesis C-methylase UbiE